MTAALDRSIMGLQFVELPSCGSWKRPHVPSHAWVIGLLLCCGYVCTRFVVKIPQHGIYLAAGTRLILRGGLRFFGLVPGFLVSLAA